MTFIYGPVGTGKSTVARLIDYCFGGKLEQTPAIQQEFVAVELALILGDHKCIIERSANENDSVRVTWSAADNAIGSVNAPIRPQVHRLIDAEVYNLSDLIFFLCGVSPIKVRKRRTEPDSPLIRLSIRDIWWYCYLDQTRLDSSFFRLEDPIRSRKSQDAMRFFTGLHSEILSQLDERLSRLLDEQRSKREAARQIRLFMERFELGTEAEIERSIETTQLQLVQAEARRCELEETRHAKIHPSDRLRTRLRDLGSEIADVQEAIGDLELASGEQQSLRAEFIMTKTKAERGDQAGKILDGIEYQRCPQCGVDVTSRPQSDAKCRLCGSERQEHSLGIFLDAEAIRRDLNDRIDEITDSIERRRRELKRMKKYLERLNSQKSLLDSQLQQELSRYDSAFVESIREVEREIATLLERTSALQRLKEMPDAINTIEQEASILQGEIDNIRMQIDQERERLQHADRVIAEIGETFKQIMIAISFPGVSEKDTIVLDPRNWNPTVRHNEVEWTFFDTGSGGKKTLFNVCYALAIHSVGSRFDLPVPKLLIIDSPTKNISEDEDPDLVRLLYAEIYGLARELGDDQLQFLVIDSELTKPDSELPGFSERRMAGETGAPSLVPYYVGP